MEDRNLIIIGSGPAGYTAALYAARADMYPLVIAGMQPGGQLTQTSEVENWPGEEHGVLGVELVEKMRRQAERFGAAMLQDTVVSIATEQRPFVLTTASGKTFSAKAIIFATGATAKWLGVPGESRLQAKGVSACATCDGFFFRGKKIAVIGGGDSAMEEATFLTKFAESVVIVHRSAEFKASRIMLERARKNPKISLLTNMAVEEILGEDRVSGMVLRDTVTGELQTKDIEGIFVAIGHRPATDLLAGKVALDARGYIATEGKTSKTNIPGIFACGDVMDPTYRQAITAAGSGCVAALDAERFLAEYENV